jgi:hypothetical protein
MGHVTRNEINKSIQACPCNFTSEPKSLLRMMTFLATPSRQWSPRIALCTNANAQSKSTGQSHAGAPTAAFVTLFTAHIPVAAGSCIASAETSGFDICSPTASQDSTYNSSHHPLLPRIWRLKLPSRVAPRMATTKPCGQTSSVVYAARTLYTVLPTDRRRPRSRTWTRLQRSPSNPPIP